MAADKVIFDRRTFFTGQRVFSQGDMGHTMYFVERGKVLISLGDESRPVLLGEINAGGIFGEMALIDGAPRMAHATAAEESVLHAIPQSVFQQKMQASDPFIRALVRIMLNNLRAANNKALAAEQRAA